MEQLFFKVRFQIKTSQYSNLLTDCETTVLAFSYDDAAGSTRSIYGKYKGFKLGPISPLGIPELESDVKIEDGNIANKIDNMLKIKGL